MVVMPNTLGHSSVYAPDTRIETEANRVQKGLNPIQCIDKLCGHMRDLRGPPLCQWTGHHQTTPPQDCQSHGVSGATPQNPKHPWNWRSWDIRDRLVLGPRKWMISLRFAVLGSNSPWLGLNSPPLPCFFIPPP